MSVGPIEGRFFAEFVEKLGLPELAPLQHCQEQWPEIAAKITARFLTADQSHWTDLFKESDACVFPALSYEASLEHSHMQARGTYVDHEGLKQPAPAPRFSRTSGAIQDGRDAQEMLDGWRSVHIHPR